MFMCIQNLDKLCPLILKILSENEMVTDLRNNGRTGQIQYSLHFFKSEASIWEMLHEVLDQIRSELGFQILNRLLVKIGKYCAHSSVSIFKWIFFILVSNEDNHTISN